MNITSIVKIRKLLRRCNYTVDVKHTASGCQAIFPVRLIEPILPSAEIKYTVLPDGIHCSEHVEDKTVEELWDGPIYARRLSVMCDVVYRCYKYQYNIGFIRYVKNNKRLDTIFEVLDQEMLLEDKEKEAMLLYLLSETDFGSDTKNLEEVLDIISKYDIMPGFEYLKLKFFQ